MEGALVSGETKLLLPSETEKAGDPIPTKQSMLSKNLAREFQDSETTPNSA